MNRGVLYLIPTTLGDEDYREVIPDQVAALVRRLQYFIAENPKSARRFLKSIGYPSPLSAVDIQTLDEHTRQEGFLNCFPRS